MSEFCNENLTSLNPPNWL